MTDSAATTVLPRRRRIALGISKFILDSLIALPLGCVIAMLWVNVEPESYFQFATVAAFPVNAIGMTLVFALLTKEVAESTRPGGPLHPWTRAIAPVVAAIGGTAASIAGYLAFVQYAEEPILADAWMAASAIDMPASYVIARLIFGRHSAVPYLLLLALFTDAIGLGAVALTQPIDLRYAGIGAACLIGALVWAYVLRWRLVITGYWRYLLGPGLLSWVGMYLIGLHPALALVPIVPFMTHGARDAGLLVESPPEAHDTLTRFERAFRVPVELVLFAFAIVNAGVPLRGLETGTWAIPVAALARVGGIVVAGGLAAAAGLRLPNNVRWKELLVVAATSSVGFVFALFISTAVMPFGPVLLELKMGALLTAAGAVLAVIVAAVLRVGRFGPRPREG
jgi:NhaA family Na+:H+ antiporter